MTGSEYLKAEATDVLVKHVGKAITPDLIEEMKSEVGQVVRMYQNLFIGASQDLRVTIDVQQDGALTVNIL